MLVLTRKSNQSIMIGDDIEVSVLSIMGEKVRIGIQAPRTIPVFRKEVYLEIQQEKAAGGRGEVDEALENLSYRASPQVTACGGRDGLSPSARRASRTSRTVTTTTVSRIEAWSSRKRSFWPRSIWARRR